MPIAIHSISATVPYLSSVSLGSLFILELSDYDIHSVFHTLVERRCSILEISQYVVRQRVRMAIHSIGVTVPHLSSASLGSVFHT